MRVVGLGRGHQLAAAQLDGAELAAHQRLAAERAAGRQLDDRLEVRVHPAVAQELREPVRARAVQQRLRRHRQPLLVGEADGEQAGALGQRQRADDGLQPLVPPRAGQQQTLHGDVARGGLGGEVLDLVEHGRPVREQSHAVHRGGGRGHNLCSRPEGPPALRRDGVDRALVGGVDRPAERSRRLRARVRRVELGGEVGQHEPLGLRLRAVLARLLRRQVAALAVGARAPAAWPRSAAGRCPCASSRERVVGRAVGGEREAGAVVARTRRRCRG